jgi:HlyD family secretion protein
MKRKSIFKRPLFWLSILVVVAIIAAGIVFGTRRPSTQTITATATVQDLKQIVSVTGNVEPITDVSLSFEKSGTVNAIYADVGDSVTAGETLMTLANADLKAQLAQAQADVATQEAKLASLQAGDTPEQIAVEQVKLQNDQNAIVSAQETAINTANTAYTNADDIVHNTIDQFFSNPTSNNPQFNLQASYQLKSNIVADRVAMETLLSSWRSELYAVSSATTTTTGSIEAVLSDATNNLTQVKAFIDLVASAINSLDSSSSATSGTSSYGAYSTQSAATSASSYKQSISAARATADEQISALTASSQALQNAQDAVTLEQAQLALAQTPARPQDIAAQQAQVASAQANVTNIQVALDKTVLKAPISGVVTERNPEVGETVAGAEVVIALISHNEYKITANVAETDIANVAVGDAADITLDAYQGVNYQAKVTQIDPAQTIVDGVPTYKVTLNFTTDDPRVKPGMTANIDITTATAFQSVAIPQRAIITQSDGKYVNLSSSGTITKVPVTVGIIDQSGLQQVVSGIAAGDVVVISNQ